MHAALRFVEMKDFIKFSRILCSSETRQNVESGTDYNTDVVVANRPQGTSVPNEHFSLSELFIIAFIILSYYVITALSL